jgi:hypothetical protein
MDPTVTTQGPPFDHNGPFPSKRGLILVSVAQLIPSLHLHAADLRARLDTSTRTRWHVQDAGHAASMVRR